MRVGQCVSATSRLHIALCRGRRRLNGIASTLRRRTASATALRRHVTSLFGRRCGLLSRLYAACCRGPGSRLHDNRVFRRIHGAVSSFSSKRKCTGLRTVIGSNYGSIITHLHHRLPGFGRTSFHLLYCFYTNFSVRAVYLFARRSSGGL